MKNITSMLRLTLVLIVIFCIYYPLMVFGVAQAAPNNGKGEILTIDGKTVGYKRIGQKFDKPGFFWGRPSAVDYNAAGSAGSNKGPSNPDYLIQVQKRIDAFLVAHPYLKKSDVPADIVTASGSGLDPHISPQAALIQVKRVAKERNLDESKVRSLVEKHIEKPTVAGTETVNVLELNLELQQLKHSNISK
ncbi:K(+)-transporting ATPase subunit C [Flavobacterium sp. MAH-1]|uniref:Potassium-transporting ATPase KdpC subunit n=1 Tax=Flavobacterium agri TaxID=2743471 RepID=A0A7Y8XZI4_9FLAO|nr:K(+)-transporting ATPase subunit C [Flavobacterium agri]NUY79597.1 K(+)-transporting ATPase subunit C [Flavobacterium agri]NYA69622.1 K(+)-transporting ATPase subunit C [Flavobacterium agri]